jgi:hypothetical protein
MATIYIAFARARFRSSSCRAQKRRFSTRQQAAGYGIGDKNGFRVFPYRCTGCDGWHLTKRKFGKDVSR